MVTRDRPASRRRLSGARMPPLDSLRAFEAVARHRSFTSAARELHVTQSAVSQRIRALELDLGTALFHRVPHGLEPTDEGAGLAAAMGRALAEIGAGLAAFDSAADNVLTVSVLPSFASRWLVPRLGGFQARHPEVEVRIDADAQLAQLQSGATDVALRFGLGHYPGLRSVPLMGDAAQPVLSPRLLQRHGPLADPAAMARLPLLHDSTATTSDVSWAGWFARVGRPDVACDDGPRFSNAMLAVEAAASGLGVALARMSLVGDDLASGGLIAPFPPALPTDFSYWLVTLPEKADTPRIAAFCAWLHEEVGRGAAPEG